MLKLISKTAENREDIKVMCALQRNNHVTEKKHLAIMSHWKMQQHDHLHNYHHFYLHHQHPTLLSPKASIYMPLIFSIYGTFKPMKTFPNSANRVSSYHFPLCFKKCFKYMYYKLHRSVFISSLPCGSHYLGLSGQACFQTFTIWHNGLHLAFSAHHFVCCFLIQSCCFM